MKALITSALLLFAISIQSFAQTKYEYGVITYTAHNSEVSLTLNDKFEQFKFEKGSTKAKLDLRPLMGKIKDITDQGWEIYSTDVTEYALIYQLKRVVE